MRIALFHFPSLRLGGDTFVFDAARAWVEMGHEVTVVTSDSTRAVSASVNMEEEDVRRRLGRARLVELPTRTLMLAGSSRAALARRLEQADVVYAKNEMFELLASLRAAGATPVVCGAHTATRYPHGRSRRALLHNRVYLSRTYGRILRRCAGIHVLNPDDAALVHERFRVPEDRIRVLPVGVELDTFRPVASESHFFRILFAGKLDEQKGVDVLAAALAGLPPEVARRVRLTVLGRGPLSPQLERLEGRLGELALRGFVPQDELPALFAAQDLAVVPSRWETLSYVAVEAHASGVPVVASRIPGPSSVVRDGVDGWLVPAEDAPALAAAIRRAIAMASNDPAAYASMRLEARRNAEARFDARQLLRDLADWMGKVAGRHAP